MRRREFMAMLGGEFILWPLASAAWPTAAIAQQHGLPVVGFVSSRSAEGPLMSWWRFSKGSAKAVIARALMSRSSTAGPKTVMIVFLIWSPILSA